MDPSSEQYRHQTKLLRAASPSPSSASAAVIPYDTDAQSEFNSDLCRTFVSTGWSWRTVENYEVQKLFQRHAPGAFLPDRKKLAGPLLQMEVEKVEQGITVRMKGTYATLQWDGWVNRRRLNLLAFMVSAAREVRLLFIYFCIPSK